MREITVIEAINLAIEGQLFLREKWRGSYGSNFSTEIRKHRASEIADVIAALARLREGQSCK